jgi:hypothetical protein
MWKGKKGYIVEKKFDNDFAGALDAYTTLKAAGKKWVTLRCCNVGFAPPRNITHAPVATYKIVTRGGKKYKKKVITETDLMPEYNAKDVWWCPFCIKLRRFYRDTDEPYRVVMRCPVCEISNYDWHVKRWNPQAKTIEFRRARVKRSTRRSRRSK